MRFKEFLLEDSKLPVMRGIYEKPAIEWLKLHSPKYLAKLRKDSSLAILRGVKTVDESDGTYFLGDSSKFSRLSTNKSNFINLFLTTSKAWSDYPPRTKAYIGAVNDETVTDSYGDTYLMIPADDAEIGVCPDPDFWFSFRKIEALQLSSISSVANTINAIAKFNHIVLDALGKADVLNDNLNSITIDDVASAIHTRGNLKDPFLDYAVRIFNSMQVEKTNTVGEWLEKILEPSGNGIIKVTGATFKADESAEVWVVGEVLLIKNGEDTMEWLEENVYNEI